MRPLTHSPTSWTPPNTYIYTHVTHSKQIYLFSVCMFCATPDFAPLLSPCSSNLRVVFPHATTRAQIYNLPHVFWFPRCSPPPGYFSPSRSNLQIHIWEKLRTFSPTALKYESLTTIKRRRRRRRRHRYIYIIQLKKKVKTRKKTYIKYIEGPSDNSSKERHIYTRMLYSQSHEKWHFRCCKARASYKSVKLYICAIRRCLLFRFCGTRTRWKIKSLFVRHLGLGESWKNLSDQSCLAAGFSFS